MKRILVAAFLLTIYSAAVAQTDSLRHKIQNLLASKQATVGVSIAGIEDSDTLSINGNLHLPLQSVFKFHIALTVLREVDKGKLSLSQKIYIAKKDLLPNTWSPLRLQYPDGNIRVSLAEILEYTVSRSDNNGCDILLKLIGGTKKVNDCIHKAGIKDFNIKANEADMHKAWNIQFSNWSTAVASTDLLKLFYNRKLLSQKSYDYLWQIMTQSSTGKARIRALLPPGTIVADKTGTSDTNKAGVTAATNDIGIVQLPNGKHFAISIFVSDSKENGAANEKIIADISRLAWDYFVNK